MSDGIDALDAALRGARDLPHESVEAAVAEMHAALRRVVAVNMDKLDVYAARNVFDIPADMPLPREAAAAAGLREARRVNATARDAAIAGRERRLASGEAAAASAAHEAVLQCASDVDGWRSRAGELRRQLRAERAAASRLRLELVELQRACALSGGGAVSAQRIHDSLSSAGGELRALLNSSSRSRSRGCRCSAPHHCCRIQGDRSAGAQACRCAPASPQ